MAKKVKMESKETKDMKKIDEMTNRVTMAIMDEMSNIEIENGLTVAEGTTILAVSICKIFEAIANQTNSDVKDHLLVFREALRRWTD